MAGVPARELGDEELVAELESLARKRVDTLRFGSDEALANHRARSAELEAEYLRRRPQREFEDGPRVERGHGSHGSVTADAGEAGADDAAATAGDETAGPLPFSPAELDEAVAAAKFPADKAALVAAAEKAGAGAAVLDALDALADDQQYVDAADVRTTVGL